MPQAFVLEMSTNWVALARAGNPNNARIPKWPAYSVEKRETMLFNNEIQLVNDPQHSARLAMERVLKLS